ncbi:MAG: ABC transporter substrate-binding protein [Bacillota bacterium]|nr:ABC transporter substrate-binding protein [Bacillota bacterium]
MSDKAFWRRALPLLLTLVLATALLGGCRREPDAGIIGGADGSTSILLTPSFDSEQLTELTVVLDWTPNINHSGIYAAQALGYFAEQGLDVSIVQPGDNYALQIVAAGQAEFGVSYQEEVTFARAAGLPVLSLAAVIQHNTSCFAAPAGKSIDSVADFSGNIYGGWGGEVEEELLNYLVEQQGMAEPVEIINIGSADFFTATETTVDFSWIFYGVTGVEAELRGVELDVIYLRDIAPEFDYYTPVIVAEEDWLAANGELAGRFMSALSRGYQYADAEPQAAAALLIQAEAGLDAELVAAGQQWLAGQYQGDAPYWGWQDIEVWQGFADWLYQRGLLAEEFDAAAAFSNDYLPQQ